MRTRGVAVVWVLVTAMGVVPAAQTCGPVPPRVNKPGFRPSAIITYAVAPSPSGLPFPEAMVPCVARAFDAWTAANAESSLDVRFVPGPGGIVVRFDDLRRLLPRDVAGAWLNAMRAADGALEGAEILLSPNPAVLDSCLGVTKTVLHEIGHLHGLADHAGPKGSSVMNSLGRKNDRGGRIPTAPTSCDALQASSASAIVSAARVETAFPPDTRGRAEARPAGAVRFARRMP
jgi:hypothetical protein